MLPKNLAFKLVPLSDIWEMQIMADLKYAQGKYAIPYSRIYAIIPSDMF
jgi:hypothetical protein